MSKVAIQGNASGTGTVTLAAPNTNTDYTVNLPSDSIATLTDGATITPDFATNNNFTVTLGGNRTMANPSNLRLVRVGVSSLCKTQRVAAPCRGAATGILLAARLLR